MVTDAGEAIGDAASQTKQAVVETTVATGEAIGSVASQASKAAVETATEFGGAVGGTAVQASQAVVKTAVATGENIGSAATIVGQAVVGTATGTGGAIAGAASQAGEAVVGTAVGVGEAIGSGISQAGEAVVGTAVGVGKPVGDSVFQATQAVGYAITSFSNNPQFQEVIKSLQVDWLVKLIDQVDIVKAETEVRMLQQQYPNKQPSEIAHHLMLEKALFAAGTGFASSLMPGTAVALLAVDLAAIMLLQAEMVYQIACAYGFDLQEPARKGEVLAIFGLSLGGREVLKVGTSYATKAGLGILRNVPVAGAVIGASTNAAMIYTLGYGACRFYEGQI